jgi:hypothetical protein
MFEESDKTLLCSDLFHQNGDLIAITDKDILEAHKSYVPKTLATMHGSSFFGDCSKALIELNGVMKEVWGKK